MSHTDHPFTTEIALGYTLASGRLFCSIVEWQAYAENLLGRPILTHEFADEELWDQLRGSFETLAIQASANTKPE
jgi:hypothetical protein